MGLNMPILESIEPEKTSGNRAHLDSKKDLAMNFASGQTSSAGLLSPKCVV